MKNVLFISFLLLTHFAFAQVDFYGLARKNNPTNEIYLAKIDPNSGIVTNISSSSLSPMVNLTGAALNPYANRYYFMGATTIKTIDLTTGAVLVDTPLSNPLGASYFDNFRFNNSDSSLYGLARRNVYNSATNTYSGEVYLATINTQTGVITQISPSSLGQGYALAGSAIDPYQKVFYYSVGDTLLGIDMYTGLIYSKAPIQHTRTNQVFDNFSYSCTDTAIYGLVRDNYFTTTYDSVLMDSIQVLDSTSIRLARINPSTGQLTIISPYSIAQGGYTLNAGSTIDPNIAVFYYNNGAQLVGVSLNSGLIVTQPLITNSNGMFFELMRIAANCENATSPVRQNPLLSITGTAANSNQGIYIYPNPSERFLQVQTADKILRYAVYTMTGALMESGSAVATQVRINTANYPAGAYLLKVISNKGVHTATFVH